MNSGSCVDLTLQLTDTYGTESASYGAGTASSCTTGATDAPSCTPPGQVTISGGSIRCSGGTTTLTASGANSYLWNTGATTPSIVVGIGTYSVTATDAVNCTSTASFTVSSSSG
ncbi:MAG: hypothetical protein H6559_26350 [Lewinellaceae bacterium]|nr:hypothetical protein [Lewinellaceae bacterium]